jgi:urease accessory protein
MTTTTDPADLLRLTQWLSPAFPLSSYAYSHGLEAAMAEGRVRGAGDLVGWAAAVLRHGSGALDAWALRRACAGDDPDGLTDLLAARAGGAERWEETCAQGAALTATLGEMGQGRDTPRPLPVALGLRARGLAVPPATLGTLYLQAFAAQIVSAAVRFLPLGQAEGQGATSALHPVILEVAARDDAAPPPQAAFAAELDAMAHETLQPRIFRT